MSTETTTASRQRMPRAVLLLIGAGGAVAVIAGLRSFSGTLGPTFLALVLVILVSPLQGALRRRGVPSWVGVVALLVILYAGVLALATALAWSVAQLASLLTSYKDKFVTLYDETLDLAAKLGIGESQITALTKDIDTSKIVSSASSLATTLVSELSSGLTAFGLILLLLFFLALDASAFPALLRRASRTHPDAAAAMHTFASGTRRYLAVATVFGAVVAALDVGVLYLVGVPLPLLWGLLALISNYIANIGFVIGVIPPTLLALLAEGPKEALVVLIVYTVINIVIQGLIQPKVAGDAVGLSSSLTFFSVIFWGFALGWLGALLAVPLSLLTRVVLVDADPSARWLLPLIAGHVDPSDPDDNEPAGSADGTDDPSATDPSADDPSADDPSADDPTAGTPEVRTAPVAR